tara:strand:+ start:3770 stop:5200 length:1431 start_codon:yes stop_codon:yes gene_type:complete
MGVRGNNKATYLVYEEIQHLRVDVDAPPVAIYKRLDTELNKEVENKTYQVIIPVPNNKNGVRKSLKTSNRDRAILKAGDEVVKVRSQIEMGVQLRTSPVSKLVEAFLEHKNNNVRGEWEGKEDKGTKSITKLRYGNIKSKLKNYFVRYIGAKTDAKTLKPNQFNDKWETWRMNNSVVGGQPKQATIKDEIVIIRDLWGWGQRNGFIKDTAAKPFDDVNLKPDEKTNRETWELDEYKVFSRRLREWKKQVDKTDDIEDQWYAHLAYNLTYFLVNSGLRVGECFKLKWKDIDYYQNHVSHYESDKTGVLVSVHKSGKTGSREVNSNGGLFLKRIEEKSKHTNKEDFVLHDLDGNQLSTRWFSELWNEIRDFTGEKKRHGKKIDPYSIRHYYATQRIYAGVQTSFIARNMGITETRLRKSYDHAFSRMASEELFKKGNTQVSPKVQNAGRGVYDLIKLVGSKRKEPNPLELDLVHSKEY